MRIQQISRLDQVYRSIVLSKFFTKGWGKPENLKRLFNFRKVVSNRESCFKLVSPDYPVNIVKEEVTSDYRLLEGHFLSPFVTHLPGLLPKEAELAHFQVLLPKSWQSKHKPMCIHMAGTGDHYFWRRRHIMARPLLKSAGIGAIILENPFYGVRKPKDQTRSSLLNVSDIFVMGGCLILEALVLLHWCEREGLGPLGVTGMSMGGHMASLAATNWPKPLVVVPCLSWSTASSVFTKDAFRAGQDFAKNFPESMDQLDIDFTQTSPQQDLNNAVERARAVMGGAPVNVLADFHESKARLLSSAGSNQGSKTEGRRCQEEVFQFMRGIMDECTHLSNFSVPFDTELIIAVAAEADGYVPRDDVAPLTEIWPGAQVRYLDAGHVSAFVLYQKMFRIAVIDAFERAVKKYYS
ncbi:hypothetical protein B566_EDAN001466 [Ephemera danica]|nr:hypothetical protein B566_EDAN001466 [Ephemera danica]